MSQLWQTIGLLISGVVAICCLNLAVRLLFGNGVQYDLNRLNQKHRRITDEEIARVLRRPQ